MELHNPHIKGKGKSATNEVIWPPVAWSNSPVAWSNKDILSLQFASPQTWTSTCTVQYGICSELHEQALNEYTTCIRAISLHDSKKTAYQVYKFMELRTDRFNLLHSLLSFTGWNVSGLVAVADRNTSPLLEFTLVLFLKLVTFLGICIQSIKVSQGTVFIQGHRPLNQ